MLKIASLLIMIALNILLGAGILLRLRFKGWGWEQAALTFPLGLGVSTLLTFLLDVAGVPLTFFSISSLLFITTLLLLYPVLKNFTLPSPVRLLPRERLKLHPAELVFLLAIFFLYIISAWRCIYLPITAYDAIQGIDLVAKYGALEGHIHSRVFQDLAGELSTQPYYAPFTMLSQLLYRLAGHPFGKVWLTLMVLSFVILMYLHLRRELHPVLAGFLMILLLTIPEMYAYTFIVQTDLSNAIFVSLAIVYGWRYLQEKDSSLFRVSALLMGLGAWSRSETIAFAALAALLLLFYLLPTASSRKSAFARAGLFSFISFLFFGLWNLYYLPVELHYTPEAYFKFFFWDAQRLITLWNGMWNVLTDTTYWGYILYIFGVVAVVNLAGYRDRCNLFLLLWVLLLFLGFVVLLYHLQLNIAANIKYTFRRGSFKFYPIMIYYLGTSAFLKRISSVITAWEMGEKDEPETANS